MRAGVLVPALVATVLLSAGSALAAPPAILTVGQVSRHPTATWSLPTGVESRVIEVATDPATGSDGYFFSENVVALDVPTSTDTSWTYTYQLDPGTYYVHVGGSDTTCSTCPVREFSSILTLDIPAPPPPPLPPPPPVLPTPPAISSAVGDGRGMIAVAWNLPIGVTSSVIQISRDLTVDALGFFTSTGQVDYAVLSSAQTTYTTSYAEPPGTYYVHVAGTESAYAARYVWSAPATVTVPARTEVAKHARARGATTKIARRGNASSVVRSGTKAYAASARTLIRRIRACARRACAARRVRAFALRQLAYEHSVRRDAVRPARCGPAARGLGYRLRKSEASTSALRRALLRGQRGARLKATTRSARFRVGKAIASSRRYVVACA